MAKVVVAGRIHPDGMALLEAQTGLELTTFTDPGAELPAKALAEADALLIRYGNLTETQAKAMPKLKLVSRHGVGCDNLPTEALARRGIPVTIVGPVNAVSVAEHTMAMLFALLKRTLSYDRAVRDGGWAIRDSLSVGEAAGRKLLLLGFGRIGQLVARRALAFDMDVLAYDPFIPAETITAAGCKAVMDWRTALPEADVLSLHLPITQETKQILSAAEFAAMKPTALVLNAARGELVDEPALIAALKGHLSQGGAGLDCFAEEPLPADSPLGTLPNVVLSPHSAALSAEAGQAMGVVAAQNVIDGLGGKLNPSLIFNVVALKAAGHEY